MPYNFVLTVFIQRNVVADFLQAKSDFTPKTAVLRSWATFGGLGATYEDPFKLIAKRVVEFLLVLIELFSLLWLRCYERISVRNRRLRSNGGRLTQNFNHFSSQKTRLNDLSCGIKIWTDLSSILSQCTRLTDRRTYRRTPFSSLVRAGISCSTEKMHCQRKSTSSVSTFCALLLNFLDAGFCRLKN